MGKGRSMWAGIEVEAAACVAGSVIAASGVTAAIVCRTASSVRPLEVPVGKLQADSEATRATIDVPKTRCLRFTDHP